MLDIIQDNDIKLLRIFRAIAESGGFSLAQAKLNISLSAISTYMSHLETRLGVRLCERGHGVFRLTDEGRATLEATEKLFAALENFQTDVAESQNKLVGELRIGLIDNCVTHPDSRIRAALRNFSDRAPDARTKIYVGGAIDLEEQVMDGRLHLAVGLFHHRVTGLEYIPLFKEDHLLYCGADHPLFNRCDTDLSSEDFSKANYVSWGYIESLPDWTPPFAFNDVASSPYIEGISFFVLSGRFLAYLPTHYASFWSEQNLMRPLLPETIRRTAEFHLIINSSRKASQLTRAFCEDLGSPIQQDLASAQNSEIN